mmetsp:Transcript_48654/g.89691  ORF Transcript_48654/g.89691 Transcript_48654/m.89691 type:complete len:878 (+) Transcript_48654:42-2675(+)
MSAEGPQGSTSEPAAFADNTPIELLGPSPGSGTGHHSMASPYASAGKRSQSNIARQPSSATTPLRDDVQQERLGLAATMPAYTSATARRSATPIATRTAHQALATLAESVSASVTTLQQQAEADRRRVMALERRLEAAAEERNKDSDWRDRLAEVQGSVAGLLDEAQAQARRVDALEERLWMRSGSSEGAKQRSRELEQRLQALEQQTKHGILSLEEVHKKQSTRLCRSEKAAEDLGHRLSNMEELVRSLKADNQTTASSLEDKLVSIEQQVVDAVTEMQSFQVQLAQKAQVDTARELPTAAQIDEALQAFEKSNATVEKRVCGQVEELSSALASLRVKVDGGHRRLASLAERLDVSQQSASEGFREELLLLREQDRRENELIAASLRELVQQVAEESAQGIQGLRKVQQELAKASTSTFEVDAWRAIEESVNAHAQELATLFVDVTELRAFTEPLANSGLSGQVVEQLIDLAGTCPEFASSNARLQALEDWKSWHSSSADQEARNQAGLASTVSETTAQLSKLAVRVSQSEASNATLHQTVNVMQEQLAFKEGQATLNESGNVAELDAKLEGMSHRIADVVSRVLEVEGALEFVRHAEQSVLSSVPSVKEAWAADQEDGLLTVKQDVLSGLIDRVTKLEQVPEVHLPSHHSREETPPRTGIKYQSLRVASSPGSDGGSCSAPVQLDFLSREVGEFHARLRAVELDVQSMRINFLKPDSVQQQASKLQTPPKPVNDLSAVSTTIDESGADVTYSNAGDSFLVVDTGDGQPHPRATPVQTELEEIRRLVVDTGDAVKDTSTELNEVRSRLAEAEQGFEELRHDVDTLRAHQVAEDLALHAPEGGQAVKLARDMLDTLCDQVADLQRKMEESGRSAAQA